MSKRGSERKIIIVLWLSFIGLAGWGVVMKGNIVTDFSIFLPKGSNAQDRLLLFLLREGNGSRTMLVSMEGDSAEALARLNKRITKELMATGRFVQIINGEAGFIQDDISFFFRNRYLLSPGVKKGTFTARGLRESLERQVKKLSASRGILQKRYFANDPSGEFLQVMKNMSVGKELQRHGGVWFSKDRRRTFFVAEVRSPPFLINSLQDDLGLIRKKYEEYKSGDMTLFVTGIPVFALQTRNIIRDEALLFSIIGSILVTGFLVWVFRSVLLLVLIAVPLVSGVLAAVTAVTFLFGSIHGITLSFGVALMGIGVDYPIHAVLPVANTPKRIGVHLERIWPTLRMAAISTCVGFSAMLLAGFEGLVHLGTFAVSGLIVTAIVTRWVVPPILLLRPGVRPKTVKMPRFEIQLGLVRTVKWSSLAILGMGCIYLVFTGTSLWNDDIGRLSPGSAKQKIKDLQLRYELGVPQDRYLGLVWGQSADEVLVRTEQLVPVLDNLISRGSLGGYEMAATLLPSKEKQAYRRKLLPNEEMLRKNLEIASRGLPFKESGFGSFIEDLQRSRAAPDIELETLTPNAFRLRLEGLLFPFERRWVGVIRLRRPNNIESLQEELALSLPRYFRLLDIKTQTTNMLEHFRTEAIRWLWIGGILLIMLIYLWLLNWMTLLSVVIPVSTSLVATIFILFKIEGGLTVFHLISLLLIAGLGLDYSLFFQRHFASIEERTHTLRAILVCCGTTFIGFSILAFSKTLVLHAIGLSVGIGVPMSLLFSAMWSRGDRRGRGTDTLKY